MRVLLIEDVKISRITLNYTLKNAKYKVTACATGLEGLEAFRNNAYDVVVTDLRLPKTDGLEILKEVKKSNASLPVIIMTAYASVETAVQALKLGAYDYLTKPFSPDELLSMLKRIRELRRALDENVRLKKRIKSLRSAPLSANPRQCINYKTPLRWLPKTISLFSFRVKAEQAKK